jgi:hypothetical protein
MKTATRYVIRMTLAKSGEVRESRAYTARDVKAHVKAIGASILFSSVKVCELARS